MVSVQQRQANDLLQALGALRSALPPQELRSNVRLILPALHYITREGSCLGHRNAYIPLTAAFVTFPTEEAQNAIPAQAVAVENFRHPGRPTVTMYWLGKQLTAEERDRFIYGLSILRNILIHISRREEAPRALLNWVKDAASMLDDHLRVLQSIKEEIHGLQAARAFYGECEHQLQA